MTFIGHGFSLYLSIACIRRMAMLRIIENQYHGGISIMAAGVCNQYQAA